MTFRGRTETVDYWCDSLAHINVDDDQRRVTVIGADDPRREDESAETVTVYVDDMRMPAHVGRLNARWSHLLADTDEELHAFAARLGLRRTWHQRPGTAISHYDVTDIKRNVAIRLGAVPVSYMGEEVLELIRRKRAALGLGPPAPDQPQAKPRG